MKKLIFILPVFFALSAGAQSLPPGLLGGMLKSDSWKIYKDKQTEEFEGNVRYDSEFYKLRAAKAVSNRADNIFTLNKNVYLFNKDVAGTTAEVTADNIVFNLNTAQGTAREGNKTPLKIVYTTAGNTLEANGKTGVFNTAKETLNLKDNVKIKYTAPEDFILAFANTAFIDRKNEVLDLSGNVSLDSREYSVQAHNVKMDNKANYLIISGGRPVVSATKENFDIAMQSEKIEMDTLNKKIKAQGRINGWIQQK